ncbi:radical SAM protein [Candidatus Bathyarchaeota archaeon]|nr:radical SAM protein [Candidatus Bathyarchaeota archaeon]
MIDCEKQYNLLFRLFNELIPDRLRVSIGSAAVLGLLNYRLSVPPTTAYLMSYTDGPCLANCSFCAQACGNEADHDKLSRVIWPDFSVKNILVGFKEPAYPVLERVCYQVINYPGFLRDAVDIIKMLKRETRLPVSVDICPISSTGLYKLHEAGAEYISIPLDGATKEIFNKVKGVDVNGPYQWNTHFKALDSAVNVFGKGRVGSNIIIGLGESEREAVELVQHLHEMCINPVLFAFTPVPGTRLESLSQPDVDNYRRIQIARYLIVNEYATIDEIAFEDGRIKEFMVSNLASLLRDGEAFRTTGCPGCNRPFYNERPLGPFYNYPRKLTEAEIQKELEEIGFM